MPFYLIKTPKILINLFSSLMWRKSTSKKELYLTFDDGPIPEVTPFVLDALKKANAKATFFCIGENIEKYPHIFQRIISEQHAVGNHTDTHLNGWKTTTKNYIDSIELCQSKIQNSLTNNINNRQNSKKNILFRPPYGKITSKQSKTLRKKGYQIVLWDVISADFDSKITKEKCLQNVVKNTAKGSIIVFHDSLKAQEKMEFTLPKVLSYFSEKGFIFKTLTE